MIKHADITATCPVPQDAYPQIVMGHGSGGRLSAELIRDLFLPAFGNGILAALEDQASLRVGGSTIAFTTDAFVVQPRFFPGGDIGQLAINGTVNDLAVGGARPLFIAAAFILEEGLDLGELRRVADSMGNACRRAGVQLVAGDTKVVERGSGDGVFITTTGIGLRPENLVLSAASARPGDLVILSGTIGDHGVAVMSVRESLEFETTLESDTAPLASLTERMLDVAPEIRCMRDPTRGGLASALNEIAAASSCGIAVREADIPVRPEVHGACAILGLDPLYVANEGKLVAIVPARHADRLLEAMREHPQGRNAAVIGEVNDSRPGVVSLLSRAGGKRMVPLLTGEQLPRIC